MHDSQVDVFRHLAGAKAVFGDGPASGLYISQDYGVAGTLTFSSGSIVAVPFLIPWNVTVDRIGIEVVTLASGTARLGIYRAAGDGNPCNVSRVLDAGTVSVASTGIKEVSIDQALTPGLHWLMYWAGASAAVRGSTSSPSGPLVCWDCAPAASSTTLLVDSGRAASMRIGGVTYGSAFPSTFDMTATAGTSTWYRNAPSPFITLRVK